MAVAYRGDLERGFLGIPHNPKKHRVDCYGNSSLVSVTSAVKVSVWVR